MTKTVHKTAPRGSVGPGAGWVGEYGVHGVGEYGGVGASWSPGVGCLRGAGMVEAQSVGGYWV